MLCFWRVFFFLPEWLQKKRPYLTLDKTLFIFFLSPHPKSRLLMGSAITSYVSLLTSTSWFTCLLTSLFSAISTWQALPGCYFWTGPWALPWWSQCYLFRLKFKKKIVSQILIDSDEERKEVTSCYCAVPKPQGQQTPSAVCKFSSLSLKQTHTIHGKNLFWCRSHKVNVYPVFEQLIHPSKRSPIFGPTTLGSSYPAPAPELKLILASTVSCLETAQLPPKRNYMQSYNRVGWQKNYTSSS